MSKLPRLEKAWKELCISTNHNAHEVKQGEITFAPFECKIVSL